MSTILFSGRFSKVHTGHIITIQRLGERYDLVIVCVLNYPECPNSLYSRMNALNEALARSKGNYMVMSNKTHFGKIKWAEIEKELPPFTHYGSGNQKVLKYMDIELDMTNREAMYIPRYPGYSASKEED